VFPNDGSDKCPVCGADIERPPAATAAVPPPATEQIATRDLWPSTEEAMEALISPTVVTETIRTRPEPPWYRQSWFLASAGLALIVLLVIVALAVSDNGDNLDALVPADTGTPFGQTPVPTPQQEQGGAPPGEGPGGLAELEGAERTAAPGSAPADENGEGQRVEAASLEGTGSKRGPVFELTGGRQILRYTIDGTGSDLAIYVVKEGEPRGTTPDATASERKNGRAVLDKPAGRYYLDVVASNANWTAKLFEFR
jgi:hypothetical protein